jgi:HAE1 family hydrophobic/amphiphilic exporter-1
VISHFNMFPSAQISGVPAEGRSSGEAVSVMESIAARTLPSSMGFDWSGVTYQQLAAGNAAPFIFGLAILFVFLFLSAQYESWSIPIAVMLSVPLSIFGASVATLLRSLDNNVYMQIGLVLLIGLSAKSAIMIVEFAKQLNEDGMSVHEAAVEASRLRFRPILMTAFSFILGVIPLVIASGAGAASRVSLGTAVFGGMLLSTIAGVFLIPTLYVFVMDITARFTGRKGAKAPPVEPGPTGDPVPEGA